MLTSVLQKFTNEMEALLFFKIAGIPFIVLWIGCVSIFLTLRLKFLNIFGLKHAFDILRGKFNGNDSNQQVTPFQALMSSMAATIGTGSIVGVAVAISKGGPGAVFWMMVFGFFSMTVKCVEVFLGHKYRIVNADGTITGGPFIYLREGLKKMGFTRLGVWLSVAFSICGVFAVLGIAGFQSNQVVMVLTHEDGFTFKKVVTSAIITCIVAYIFFGGVKRISAFADKLVPLKIALYVGTVFYIICTNFSQFQAAMKLIFDRAFDFSAGMTAFFAMVVIGARRALFACEAGQGTASIINSSSNVKHSQMQGILNLLDPFITTCIVCFSTATILIMSGLYNTHDGNVNMVYQAFAMYNPIFGYIAIISIVVFALTTVITDAYNFTKIATHLKINGKVVYMVFFLFVFFAGMIQLDTIVAYADIFVVLMTVVNTFGLYFLAGEVAREFKRYFAEIKANKH